MRSHRGTRRQPCVGCEPISIAADADEVALWSRNVDTDRIAMDERARGLWDIAGSEAMTFWDLSGVSVGGPGSVSSHFS